ncbi:HTH domain-containing protein [Ligilactobacillus pobuzihii]|uniref:HTH domain-containing protein n=1 Tax=Ligilactobacillus pobuzihii TaxID=449659 RepID=UPI0019D2F82C|nr:HTH domain-containing protein [Ligilactobacillus pobuzihii]
MNLDTRQYKKGFKRLSNNFNISPHKFSKITGVSQTLIDKILQQETITFNLDDTQSVNSFNDLNTKLIILSMGFADIAPKEKVRAVIEDMVNIYQLSIDTIALYCAVTTEVLKEFTTNPFNKNINVKDIEKICVYSLFLYKTLDPDIENK